MKKCRGMAVVSFLLTVILMLSACGKQTLTVNSPMLIGYSVATGNDGTEDGQFITVTLEYDRPVTVESSAATDLRVTVGGNRVSESDMQVKLSDTSDLNVELTLAVTAVNNGKLSVTEAEDAAAFSGIVSQETSAPSQSPAIDCLIPSGVTLETVESAAGTSQTPASVTKAVDGRFNIRSILWVRLLENGEPVTIEPGTVVEKLDNAVAVHGHDFLTMTDQTIAQEIAAALTDAFGTAYQFSVQGNTVTACSLEPGEKTVDLEVYGY